MTKTTSKLKKLANLPVSAYTCAHCLETGKIIRNTTFRELDGAYIEIWQCSNCKMIAGIHLRSYHE